MALITGNLTRKEAESRVSAMIPRLYVICRAWGCTPDVCDEMVQETVISALTKFSQLRDSKALENWLISILNNCHRMYLRKYRHETCYEDDSLIDDITPDTSLEQERAVTQVRIAISRLSDEHRKILTLVDMEGLSYREVADVLDIRIGTVMSRISRGRDSLRNELKQLQSKKNQHSSVSPLRSIK